MGWPRICQGGAWREPREEDTEPGTNLDSVEGDEDGEESLIEGEFGVVFVGEAPFKGYACHIAGQLHIVGIP